MCFEGCWKAVSAGGHWHCITHHCRRSWRWRWQVIMGPDVDHWTRRAYIRWERERGCGVVVLRRLGCMQVLLNQCKKRINWNIGTCMCLLFKFSCSGIEKCPRPLCVFVYEDASNFRHWRRGRMRLEWMRGKGYSVYGIYFLMVVLCRNSNTILVDVERLIFAKYFMEDCYY